MKKEIKVVIGTNSWGGRTYGKLVRGSYVEETTIQKAVALAKEKGISVFDLAQDYGLGKAQPMMGRFGTQDAIVSTKYTPFRRYKRGKVRQSLERDLRELKKDFIDIYWLHLPMDIEENLGEIIELYKEGYVQNIGISNFSLEECQRAKRILDKEHIPLYGVQNHYSLINRDCEKNGVVAWCQEHGIAFWAWAVLEEGMLVDPKVQTNKSIMKVMFNRKKKKLMPLYEEMEQVGSKYELSIPQVAMAYCVSKGIVPICGCRKPYQVEELERISRIQLSNETLHRLETVADACNVKILGVDTFRFMVH